MVAPIFNEPQERKGRSTPVDIEVGKRLKLRRTLLGLTQEQLAESVGLTFQQVQKYESGLNRIGASRLLDISKALSVPVTYFFDESDQPDSLFEECDSSYQVDPFIRREAMELMRAFLKIQDNKVRQNLLELAKNLASLTTTEER